MKELLTLDIAFDSYHLVFPYFIGAVLVVLLIAMGAQRVVAATVDRSHGPAEPRRRGRFFEPGFDKVKLFGALGCTAAYILLLTPLGFLFSSILFVAAISLVLRPVFTRRALTGMALNAVLTPLAIWLVFGQLFDITLP